MSESVFRQKSIDRVSSPERLDEYVHVTRPAKALVIIATIVLAIGLASWTAYIGFDAMLDEIGVDDFVDFLNEDYDELEDDDDEDGAKSVSDDDTGKDDSDDDDESTADDNKNDSDSLD